MLVLTFLVFLFGLILGSFLLVVADRSGKNTSFMTGRSKCEKCNHVLSWFELIPLLSFVLQQGKCRHCKTALSYWYPAAELITGLFLVLVFIITAFLGLPILICYEAITLCLLAICFADMKYEIIPLPVVVVASIASCFLIYFLSPEAVLSHIFSGIGAGVFFLIIFLITRGRGMGFGDVIYAFFMGLLLGYPQILFGLYLSFVVGAIVSLILIVLKKKKLRGGTVPFGPFLVLGTFIMMIWGGEIVQFASAYFG